MGEYEWPISAESPGDIHVHKAVKCAEALAADQKAVCDYEVKTDVEIEQAEDIKRKGKQAPVQSSLPEHADKPYIDADDAWTIYVQSYYFACTTMTTVGYGDISASGNTVEQIYCMIMIFFGMAVFALVQSRVMSLKSETTTAAIAEERSSEIQ